MLQLHVERPVPEGVHQRLPAELFVKLPPLGLVGHVVPQVAEAGVRRVAEEDAGEVAAAGPGVGDPVGGEIQPDDGQDSGGQLFLLGRQDLKPQGTDLPLGDVLCLAQQAADASRAVRQAHPGDAAPPPALAVIVRPVLQLLHARPAQKAVDHGSPAVPVLRVDGPVLVHVGEIVLRHVLDIAAGAVVAVAAGRVFHGVVVKAHHPGLVQHQLAQLGPEPHLLRRLPLPGDVKAGGVDQRRAAPQIGPGGVQGRPADAAPLCPQTADVAQRPAFSPGRRCGGGEGRPVPGVDPPHGISRQTAAQLRQWVVQKLGQSPAQPEGLGEPLRSIPAEEAERGGQAVKEKVQGLPRAGQPVQGLLQLDLDLAVPLRVHQYGVEGGGSLPAGLHLRPELHPQGLLAAAQQAEAVGGLAVFPKGVQQGLEELRPVFRLHQLVEVGAAVQQFPAVPAGEEAQSLREGEAPDSRPAQLQGQDDPRQVLRQEAGVLLGGLLPEGFQDAGGHAVLGLVAGDGDLPV